MGLSASVRTFVAWGLSVAGAPYIWAGKGHQLLTRDGKVVNTADQFGRETPFVFDCSGLVTWALRTAGGPELRFTHTAQMLWNMSESPAGKPVLGRLRFYGKGEADITHVSILLAHEPGFPALILDASGGGPATLTPLDALAADAKVWVHYEARRDFVGERWLPALVPA